MSLKRRRPELIANQFACFIKQHTEGRGFCQDQIHPGLCPRTCHHTN